MNRPGIFLCMITSEIQSCGREILAIEWAISIKHVTPTK